MKRIIIAAVLTCAASAGAGPIAIGVAPSTHLREGEGWGFAPELFVHTYASLSDGLYLRPGGRVAVRGLVQDPMATDLRIEEHDLAAFGELGLIHDGRVVPSVTLLAGVARRWMTLAAHGVDTSMSRIGEDEWLPIIGAQLGVGMPLSKHILVEPFVRYEVAITDNRTHLRWGVEASVSFGP